MDVVDTTKSLHLTSNPDANSDLDWGFGTMRQGVVGFGFGFSWTFNWCGVMMGWDPRIGNRCDWSSPAGKLREASENQPKP